MSPHLALVLPNPAAFAAVKFAARRLQEFGVRVTVLVLPGLTSGQLREKLNEVESTNGFAAWVVVGATSESVFRVLATETGLPLLVSITSDAREQVMPLLQSLPVALLPAQRPDALILLLGQMAGAISAEVLQKVTLWRQADQEHARRETQVLQSELESPVTRVATQPPQQTPEVVPIESSANDAAMLEEIASRMRPRVPTREERQRDERARQEARTRVLDYSVGLRRLITAAREIARDNSHDAVSPIHLLAAMVEAERGPAYAALKNAGVNLELLAEKIVQHFPPKAAAEDGPTRALDDAAQQVLAVARQKARDRKRPCLTTVDFLEAMTLHVETTAAQALQAAQLNRDAMAQAIEQVDVQEECAEGAPKPPDPLPPPMDRQQVSSLQERLAGPGASAARTQPAPVMDVKPGAKTSTARPSRSPDPPPKPDLVPCDPQLPALEPVEKAADALLEGKLVAFPTDTMYALAADATNPAAVARLRQASGIQDRHLALLIHSLSQIKHLVPEQSSRAYAMLEELWPGPLTVIFSRNPQRFAHVASQATLALRMPGDMLSLSILSSVGRPLAVTSIDLEEAGGAVGAKQVATRLAGKLHLVMDTREPAEAAVTTVLDLTVQPPAIVRQGAMPADRITPFLKDLNK